MTNEGCFNCKHKFKAFKEVPCINCSKTPKHTEAQYQEMFTAFMRRGQEVVVLQARIKELEEERNVYQKLYLRKVARK